MKKSKVTRSLLAACSIVALSAVMYGCVHSGDSDPQPTVEMPTPYEAAKTAIAAATTAAAAQAAYDAVKGDVTAAQGAMLQAAVDARIEALMTMANADAQKMALMTAAGNIDTSDLMTAADIAAANTAIAALKAALTAATDVSDADKAMYQGQVTAAEAAVATAQSALNHDAQTMALSEAVTALQAIDLSDLSTQAMIDAADAAIADLRAALAAATELSDTEKTAAMTELATASRTVMAAQGSVDTGSQMTMLSDAHDALGAIDLDNLMTQAQIDAANAAIIALDEALKAATNLTDAQKLDATVDKRVAERKVMAAETTLAENVGNQRIALTEAGTALGEIDLDDLDTQAKIDAAQAAVDALKMALDDATHLSEAQKAMYQSQLDDAAETVKTAETGMGKMQRMTTQRTAITDAVSMARTAVAGVKDTSTDSEVASADAAVKAVKDAIEAAEDLSENAAEIISAKAVLATIEPILAAAKTSRTAYLAKMGDEDAKTMAATGKAMHLALAGPTGDGTDNALDTITAFTAGTHGITSAGLVLPIAENPGTLTQAAGPVTLEAGASAGALGSWMGMNYAHMEGTGDAKVTNEARVYTNQGPAMTQRFSGEGGKYDLVTDAGPTQGYLALTAADGDAPPSRARADAFSHTSTQTHSLPNSNTVAVVYRGTYDGAPGQFRCVPADGAPCTSGNDGKDGPDELSATNWFFKPDTGAMVSAPDADYLYYGWWVSKDSKGMPTAASAFAGRAGDAANNLAAAWSTTVEAEALTGSVTYVGNAVGKFAMDNPLDGTGDGGHFTADAELVANFGAIPTDLTDNDNGVTGTIDNFRLNDGSEDPGWSVALNRSSAWAAGGVITGPTTSATVWSINGNKAPASGMWSGAMYDETPGDPSATGPGDGNTTPTTVTGTFYSEFSTIGRMVGAFGADKQ